MPSAMLDKLFPPLPTDERRTVATRHTGDQNMTAHNGCAVTANVKTRWAAICTLELQGLDKLVIAERLGMSYSTICGITNKERYVAYREARLASLDDEFFAMKPLALRALRSGLNAPDENTALRASEQWFKAAGFGGFSRTPEAPTATNATDVARALLSQVNLQVNVNVGKE